MERQLATIAEPVVRQAGFEMVDLEFVKEGPAWYLRLFIDKEGGVSLDGCQMVSRAVEAVLDREDPIPQSYILEVSSPGLERPLKKEADLIRFQGRLVQIHTYAPVQGKKSWQGTLRGLRDGHIILETDQGLAEFSREVVARVNLVAEV